jgi:hypothetical protein
MATYTHLESDIGCKPTIWQRILSKNPVSRFSNYVSQPVVRDARLVPVKHQLDMTKQYRSRYCCTRAALVQTAASVEMVAGIAL